MQRQCPWCGKCGPRFPDNTPESEWPRMPDHDCVCRHPTCETREGAREHGGRYRCQLHGWHCFGCGTAR